MIEHRTATQEPRLVGRRREAATLWEHFETAARGHTRVVLLAGEPGIGKTRLLEAVAARALQHGAVVLRGGASEAEGMPPYLPFLEALGQHIRTAPPEELHQQVGTAASILASILPELAARLGDLPAGYPLPPEQARLRLYEAIGNFFAAIAAPRELLIVLDDLHWADTASLDLLFHLARQQPTARLLILGAYRSGEAEYHQGLQRALTELNRLRVLSTITLEPLSSTETTMLAAQYLNAFVDTAVSQFLYAQSEGNPFFAEELLRGWIETGSLIQIEGNHEESPYTLNAFGAPTLPPSIMGTVRQRLVRLLPEVTDVLRPAAIIGRTFDVMLLAEAMGQEVETVEEYLLTACHARLIRAGQDGTYTFSHDLIRECLYDEVTTTRRRRLHGFIGRALEMRATQGSAPSLAELAFHFTHSGDRERGIRYAQRAAEQAMSAYASEEAMIHYRTALDLLGPTDARRGELLLDLGKAAMLAGADRDAVAAFEAAQLWFTQTRDRMNAARAVHSLGQVWWRQEALAAARASFMSALSLLQDEPCPETVQVFVDLGSLLVMSLHQQSEGLSYSQRALELAQQLEDDHLVAAARRTVGNLLVRRNDLDAGIAMLEQALALTIAIDDPVEAAECCACLVMAHTWNSTIHRMSDLAGSCMQFAQRCHDLYQLRHVYAMLAMLNGIWGKWAEAEQMIAQAQSIVERLASPEPLAFLHFIRGQLAYQRGDYLAAEAHLAEATARFRAIGPGALVWYLGMFGIVKLVLGKQQEARACMHEVEALLVTFPTGTMPTAEPLTQLTVMALVLDDRERLAHYYPQLLAFRGQYHDFVIDRLLGEIEMRQGHWTVAKMHLATAEATARREHMRAELAHTLVAQADLERAQGGRGSAARARSLLEQARNLMEQLGMADATVRLPHRLGGLSDLLVPSAQPLLPDNLTPREVEVLCLIAAGKSNQEIAADLVLSVRTVERHISNIYMKIGAEGKVARATATAYALTHGLTQPSNT